MKGPYDKDLTLLYDGNCPLCKREIKWLCKKDKYERLGFVDISSQTFDSSSISKSDDELMRRMHAIDRNGTMVDGVEVFRRAYQIVGLGWVLWLTNFPFFRQLADICYSIFAKHRITIGQKLETFLVFWKR